MDGTVGVSLHDGEDLERLAQQGELLGMDGQLAGLRDERKPLDTHYVTDVEEFLEYSVAHGLVLAGADLIALDVHLHASGLILDLHERGGAHDAARHDASCDADILKVFLLRVVLVLDALRGLVDREQRCRIRLDAQLSQFDEGLPPQHFLLTVFDIAHNYMMIIQSPQK